MAEPFLGASKITMGSSVDLLQYFEENGYHISLVRKSNKVPRIYAVNLPPDLNALPVHDKTSLFIRLLLTSVVKVNQDIFKVRNELQRLVDKKQKNTPLTEAEEKWLADIAADYYIDGEDISALLLRVDTLPVGLIMAQAIDESGWGTSRFAKKGNALYGQHLAAHSKGPYISAAGGKVKVAAFDNLYHGTASYIHNLNTTKAYASLRTARADVRAEHGHLNGYALAGALAHYSERGEHYVKTLRWLIKHYELDELDDLTLAEGTPVVLVVFPRQD